MREFRRSSRCSNGNCVEVSIRGEDVAVRGTAPGAVLTVPHRGAWRQFIRAIKATRWEDGSAA